MEGILRDLQYSIRMLAKERGFTAVAVLALALGIGANTWVFSTVNAMLLKPFAFPHLDRIMAVSETTPKQGSGISSVSPANFRDWEEQNRSFEFLAAGHGWDANLTGEGVAERVEAFKVTPDFFRLLGLSPILGRSLGASDFSPGHTSVAVFSYGFWQRSLGSNPGIVGKTVELNGLKYVVLGVMRQDFDFPVGADAWVPLNLTDAEKADRASHYLQVIGRLKPGVSMPQALADLEAVSARLATAYPATNAGHGVKVETLVESLTQGSTQFVWTLMGAAVFVLLLACANVANLQLARGSGRQKEIALRLAVGATRGRIARQLLIESVVLALGGGAAGGLLASWGVDYSRHWIPPFILQHVAGLKHMQVDSRVLVFTFFAALATGVLSGVARAFHFSRPEVNEALKQGGRTGQDDAGQHRLRGLLVVAEIALAQVLLVATGLMVNGFRNMAQQNYGYDPTQVLTFRVALPGAKYRNSSQIREFNQAVMEKLRSLPGVESSASMSSLPSTWSWNAIDYQAEGQPPALPGEMRTTVAQSVTPEIFHVLRVPLVRGRMLTAQDGPDTPLVLVVNQKMAQRVWGNENPVGKRIRFAPAAADSPWRTVVGVVGDIRQSAFAEDPDPAAYFPFAQMPEAVTSFALRSKGDPLALAKAVRAEVKSVDADQPVFEVRTLEGILSDNLSGVENSARTMMIFGVIALVLAASGIFALMAYFVLHRTHEIGIRMALGASPADVLHLVIGYSGRLALLGLATGVLFGLGLTQALSGLLFGVFHLNALVFALLTLLLGGVAALAAYLPARWATQVDPNVALHYE
jgi:putative ABC transport system permease protein